MGRDKSKPKLPPFVPLTWEVLNSKAYIKLTSSAGKALPYFFGKHGKDYGIAFTKTKGSAFSGKPIEFTYAEAARLGFANRTFSRVIADLIDKGFIDMAGYGGMRGFCKTNNKFLLSARWVDYGERSFQAVPRYPSESS